MPDHEKHSGLRQAVRAIVIHDRALLVMERSKHGQRFVTLPGGGVEPGESKEAAVARELYEETRITAVPQRLLYHSISASGRFGEQWYFLCRYRSGEPALHPDSEEYYQNQAAAGNNTYIPKWLPLSVLAEPDLVLYPAALKARLFKDAQSGFAFSQTIEITEP